MDSPLALLNGRFVPAAEVAVPIDDAGFLLGVTVPEQLRTFAGRLFRLEQHLDRLLRGLEIVGIANPFSRSQWHDFALELVTHNYRLLPAGSDLGLTIFVTPGPQPAQPDRGPLVVMHTRPLAFASFAQLYEVGQPLVTTSIRQVPNECWPAELKCRSRMHYWLADREARQQEPDARALVQDLDGQVLEASTANLVVYRSDEGMISPPRERILPGISVGMLADLCQQQGIPFTFRLLTLDDLYTADEVLLTSTTPCLWPVLRLNGRLIGGGRPGEQFQRLVTAWSQQVELDFVAQARRAVNL